RLDTTGGGGPRVLERAHAGEASTNLLSPFVFAGRVWWVRESTDEPNRYRRWRISTARYEQATVPATRRYTIAIAPQSVSSVFWSQERAPSVSDVRGGCLPGGSEPPCQVGGEGSLGAGEGAFQRAPPAEVPVIGRRVGHGRTSVRAIVADRRPAASVAETTKR